MRNILKIISVLFCFSSVSQAETLTTNNYIVTITQQCPEGYITCDNVKYHGVSKRSGNSIELTGTTLHTKWKDGTPCRFLGYDFNNGDFTYRVLENGLLQVIKKQNEVLFEEKGTWER